MIIAIVGLLLAGLGLGLVRWTRARHEAICLNQMRAWYDGALSYCLAERIKDPNAILDLDKVKEYVHPKIRVRPCPSGSEPYAPFSVANGPVCPNGHDIAPGIPRPFRAHRPSKLARIYEAAGWTNLVIGSAEPRYTGGTRANRTAYQSAAYERGLAYLAAVQNTDGSWGTGTDHVYATAFVLLAFLNRGETPVSDRYGTNVERSLRWLLQQSPSNDLDRVSMVHAFAAGYRMTHVPALGAAAIRHRGSVDAVGLTGASAVLFSITLPPDAPLGSRMHTHEALRQFVAQSTEPAPLRLYLGALAMFVDGGSKWTDYTQQVLDPSVEMQSADGSFPPEEAGSIIESTAFALLRLSVCYPFWKDYLDVGYSKHEPEQGQGFRIKKD